MTPDVSVVIVTHETRDLTLACLESLAGSTEGMRIETFVVDNASADGTAAAVAERFPEVELITRTVNGGFSVANNAALRRARGRHTLLLNSDTVVRPGAIEAMSAFLDAHPETGLVGCRLVDGEGHTDASASGLPGMRMQIASWLGLRRLMPLVRHLLAARPLGRLVDAAAGGYFVPSAGGTEPVEVEFLSSACVMVRREVWERIGLLDERFFLYLEDADLCRRARDAGWRLHYLPGPAIVHLGGRSFAARSEGRTYHVSRERARSLVYYFGKHRGTAGSLAIRGLLVVAVAPRLALALIRRDRADATLLASILRIAVGPEPSTT